MLQVNRTPPGVSAETVRPDFSPADTLYSHIGFLRRQFSLIIFTLLLANAIVSIYLFTTPPSFTAQARMIIDARRIPPVQQQLMYGDLSADSATVDSQVEILRSTNIALSVIKDLRLTDDPEFVAPHSGPMGTLSAYISRLFQSEEPSSESQLTRRVLRVFADHLTVTRVGLTYVIDIDFRSLDPDRAAQIANATVDTYIVDQLEAKYRATRRASAWMQDRIKELRDQSSVAERAVVEFKTKHNIVDAGGHLMLEQQLAELNSQLVLSRAQTSEARARLDRIEAVLRASSPLATVDATVADSLKNEVVTKLRSQYLELANREADWSARFGRNHLAAVYLRNQMREIRNSILDELRRIAETYKSDYEIAKQREDAVQKELAQTVSQSQVANQAQVALRELESNAQTYRALYDNFLQRYMESVQQQSFPITEARLISPADRPLTKSHPKTVLLLMLSTVGGLFLGVGLAILRDLSDRVFRTTGQIQDLLGVACITVVPKLEPQTSPHGRPHRTRGKINEPARQVRRMAGSSANLKVIASSASRQTGRDPVVKPLVRPPSSIWAAVWSPFSRFTEAMRAVRHRPDLKSNKIITLTSSDCEVTAPPHKQPTEPPQEVTEPSAEPSPPASQQTDSEPVVRPIVRQPGIIWTDKQPTDPPQEVTEPPAEPSPPANQETDSEPVVRPIVRQPGIIWTAIESPLSRFAEAIRVLKRRVDVKSGKIVGFTSSHPREGKSTLAAAFALLTAQTGARVILVDCDLRNPALSRALAPDADLGIVDILSGKISLEEAVWADQSTNMTFLPAVSESHFASSSEILGSAPTKKLFKRLRASYDYVVVDLSPLAPVVDALMTTHLIDSYVFIIEWGRTSIDVAQHALGGAQEVYENLLGAVLNKADIRLLRRYENGRGDYYYSKYYSQYGYVE